MQPEVISLADPPVWPRITVVTPSFNQAPYLEATIVSVLGQCYPNLEYMVMDGGSTDDSAAIIRKYEPQLAHWVSARDGGQSAALNTAFARATGDILCWVNSDDLLMPGTLHRLARHFAGRVQEPLLCYGSCLFFEDRGKRAKVVRARPYDPAHLRLTAYIIQPSAFWTRTLWEKTGPLDGTLSFAFDWDWFIRASALGHFDSIDEIFALYRLHEAHKSGSGSDRRRREIIEVARRYGTPPHASAYEYLDRHWDSFVKQREIRNSLKRKRIPGSELFAKLAAPMPAPPANVTPDVLKICEGMLHGS